MKKLKMRKEESPEHIYEQGRLYGIFQIIKRAKKYNGLIETIDDLFEHMDRLQKCSICKRDFYDKRCPECSCKR